MPRRYWAIGRWLARPMARWNSATSMNCSDWSCSNCECCGVDGAVGGGEKGRAAAAGERRGRLGGGGADVAPVAIERPVVGGGAETRER